MEHSADSLVGAAETLTRNPFGAHAAEWLGAKRVISEHTRGRIGADTVRTLAPADLERVVLALGHLQACDGGAILARDHIDDKAWRRLPRPRSAYVRICAAAGRCSGVLAGLRGRSLLIGDVRRQTWAACFGDSLHHALDLERVIVDHDVLVLGETGTGKETVAGAIVAGTLGPDDGSPAPHAAINAAAVPATLVESELFGHVRGAFTGASEARIGRIRSASGGTLFLDEVGDLELHTQVKLLRVIETNEVTPVGADHSERAEVRYVAATHGNLETAVTNGAFRRDLYQRLAGIVIRIPPLRERPEDIVEIGRAFLAGYVTPSDDDRIERWLDDASRQRHAWPGNIRELQNALRNLMLGLAPAVGVPLSPVEEDAAPSDLPPPIAACRATLREVEDWYIRRVLDHQEHNYAAAARRLGIDRSTVRRRSRL